MHWSCVKLRLNINIFTLCLANPKSHSFTSYPEFTKKLWLFMSLWTIPRRCKNCIANKICKVILAFSFSTRAFFLLCNRSYSVPSRKYYITIHKVGGTVTAPIKRTILGCLYRESMRISLLN